MRKIKFVLGTVLLLSVFLSTANFVFAVDPVRKLSTFQQNGSHGALDSMFAVKGIISSLPPQVVGLSNGVNLPFQEQLESVGLQISSEPPAAVSTQEEAALLLNLPQVYILPDSPFYFLKKIWEGAQILLASEPEERGEVLLSLAEKRLAEAISLIKKGEWQGAVEVLQKYQGQFENAQSMLTLIRDVQKYDALRNLISRQLQNQALLAAFLEKIGAGEMLGGFQLKIPMGSLELKPIE